MKKVFLLLVFLLALPMVFSATAYSEVWFASGNSFSLDGKTYSLLFQGTGNATRILVRDEENVSMSEVISLGDCFETEYKYVCFVETNLLEGYSKRVLAEFSKKDYGFNVIVNIPDRSLFVFEENEVTLTFESKDEVKNLDFIAFFSEEIMLSKFKGCSYLKNSTGQFVILQVANPKDEEECKFVMTSQFPIKFDFVGEYYYDFIDRQERKSLSPVSVEFKKPYTLKYKYPKINSSDSFNLNVTFTNPSDKKIKFEELIFNIPNDFVTNNKKGVSSYGSNYYTFTESFSLNIGESRTFTYNFNLNYNGNYTLFFLPEIIFGDNQYKSNRLENIFILFDSEDATDSNISKFCDGDDLYVNITDPLKSSQNSKNYTFDTDRTFLPGTEIEFNIYVGSETRDIIDNLTFYLYENEKLIGKRTYSSLVGLGKILFSRVYSIIPISGATNRNYKIVGDYSCGKNYTFEYDFDLELASFADIDVEKEAPGSLITGEQDEVIVTVTNNEDWFVENILLEEIIPPEFEVEGITRRVLSLEPNSEEEAYRYFIRPISDIEKSYAVSTKITLNQNGKLQEREFEKTISINNVDLADLDVKIIQDEFYLNEPSFITFEVENEGDFPARNLVLDFDKGKSFDILKKVPYMVPTIFPGQLIKIEIPIIPREKINLTYTLNYNDEQEKDELELDVKNQRLNIPLVDYSIHYLNLIDGTINATVRVNNTHDKNVTIFIAETEIPINANSSKNIVVNIPKKLEYLLEYELFGYMYQTYPSSISTSDQIIQLEETLGDLGLIDNEHSLSDPVVIINHDDTLNSNETFVAETTVELDMAQKSLDLKKIIAIVILILTAIVGLGFLVFRGVESKNKKNSFNLKSGSTIKSEINTNSLNKGSSKQDSESNVENDLNEKNKINSSNIFSYNEYEKLKQNLNK